MHLSSFVFLWHFATPVEHSLSNYSVLQMGKDSALNSSHLAPCEDYLIQTGESKTYRMYDAGIHFSFVISKESSHSQRLTHFLDPLWLF